MLLLALGGERRTKIVPIDSRKAEGWNESRISQEERDELNRSKQRSELLLAELHNKQEFSAYAFSHLGDTAGLATATQKSSC